MLEKYGVRHASLDVQLTSARMKGNKVAKDNVRMYEKLAQINNRKPEYQMPHTYLRNLRRENITLGFPRRNFSTTKRRSPAGGNVFQPNLDLTRPYLAKKLAGNSLQGFKPLPKKLNKLGTTGNSI